MLGSEDGEAEPATVGSSDGNWLGSVDTGMLGIVLGLADWDGESLGVLLG